MDYADELDTLCRLAEALIKLQEIMENVPVQYPLAMRAYATVLHGLVVQFHVNCPHDSDCVVTAPQPCGGFSDSLLAIQEAIEALELEIIAEQPTFQYPADYSI